MTINEKKQLSAYIKGLVMESINEMPLPSGFFQGPVDLPTWAEADADPIEDEGDEWDDDDYPDKENEFWYEHDHPASRMSHYEGPDVSDELNELRRITESMARAAVKGILMEKKKKSKKKTTRSKDGKKKGSKEKTSSSEKTIMNRLNNDAVNAAHYFYKLYGVEDGTEAEKASARSKGYKKAKGKKNDTGVPYKFSSKERNKLNAMLTTDKN